VEIRDFVTGAPGLIPLAGPANKQGRIAADVALGRDARFRGTQGTGVVRIFDLVAAMTGKNEKALKQAGLPFLASYSHSTSHAGYYPGSTRLSMKLLFAPQTGKILGGQIVGRKGVDKRIDVLAVALRAGLTVFDLEELELAYAPPFSSAKDPVNMAGFVAANILKGDHEIVTVNDLDSLDPATTVLLDVRDLREVEKLGKIGDALHIPLDEPRGRLSELDKKKTIVIYCAIGLRGYLAQRILAPRGFKTKNLAGGHASWSEVQKDRAARAKK
jgi:rhodanese-related sulfurtransferase